MALETSFTDCLMIAGTVDSYPSSFDHSTASMIIVFAEGKLHKPLFG
jgi:hypothetical protein